MPTVKPILTKCRLQQIIDKADQAYYRSSTQIMSDVEYDKFKYELREIAPDDERLTRVGPQYSVRELRTKTKHSIPMGSLDNIDGGVAGYEKWYDNMCSKLGVTSLDVLVSLKMDGSSIRAKYQAGKLVEVVTRGNGEVGENITPNAVMFQNLPTILPYPIDADVRGEAMLYNADFQEICERDFARSFDEINESELSNPRAIGNGILSRDSGVDSDKIRFIAFNIVFCGETCDFKYDTEYSKMQMLEKLGFASVPHYLCTDIADIQSFYNRMIANRATLLFGIDGIVVTLNEFEYQKSFITDDIKSQMRPKYSRAIKPENTLVTTILDDVKLSVGHTGAIIPTAVLREVRVGGVNVTSALLNNWDEIERLGVAIGDEVSVFLAGEIIPKIGGCIAKSLDRKQIIEPSRCPSCGEVTTRYFRGKKGAVTYCINPEKCPEAQFGKIKHWVGTSKKGVGILNIGDNILRSIIDNNLASDPADLYALTVEQLEDLKLDSGVRIGKSRATKIINNIAKKKNLSLHVFLGSLGIDLLGRRRVQLLVRAAGGSLDKLENWLDLDNLRSLKIDGLGDTIRDSIVAGISDCTSLIQKLFVMGVTVDTDKEVKTVVDSVGDCSTVVYQPFAGITCCWTGTRDYTKEFESLGGIVKSGISKGLHLLVQKDALSVSNKTKKAESYGTKIISVDYLKKIVDGDVKIKLVDNTIQFIS